MKNYSSGQLKLVLSLVGAVSAVFLLYFISQSVLEGSILPWQQPPPPPPEELVPVGELNVEKFKSEEDFKDYIQKASLVSGGFYGTPSFRSGTPDALPAEFETSGPLAPTGIGGGEPTRVSETNVQVTGIDEPDIVKTSGKEIYFSSDLPIYYGRGVLPLMESILPYPQQQGETKIIKAFPPQELIEENPIDKSGTLLLSNNILVIFSNDGIYGYNVSNPKSPSEIWKITLDKKTFLQTSRLSDGKVYIVTRTGVSFSDPCPIRPLSVNGTQVIIPCIDIYHPTSIVPVDVTYVAMVIDPETGTVEEKVAFVGSSYSSIVYMSQDALYISYPLNPDMVDLLYEFFKEKGQGLVPDSFVERLGRLKNYDISNAAKLTELMYILEQHQNSLSDDERLRFENEITNRAEAYFKEHARDISKTEIVKINLSSFAVHATGKVPGGLMNQFSLDEYQGNLRVATTIDDNAFYFGSFGNESFSDVYILDSALNTIGSVKDLGLTEKIYSVRFVQDKGYVVTFRQIDPFYVIDLSDSQNPELKGELKIPGYSSYLHPITKDLILGVGKEGSQVKISLFDVSNPAVPQEKAKYTLAEYWSDVLNTHHAFLMDDKHEVFFLPGSKGGYIFSYKDNKIELKRAVSDVRAKRAVYINDYMYIIGDDKIVVLDETNWQEVKKLAF